MQARIRPEDCVTTIDTSRHAVSLYLTVEMASNFSAITEPKIHHRNHSSRIVEILSKLCLLKVNVAKYKACSKKDRTFAIKALFYNILITVPFKAVPSTGDTPFPTFLPLLECFLERTFCDSAQFSYRIFPNLHVF
jgi:hypothetical protein